ncbi:MAG: hypothetical protein II956_12340 [Bacteroidales bacterium]|nr:hypothetical protein [Bacteroidales bacterium]
MKRLFQLLAIFAVMSLIFVSCDEDAFDREDAFVTVTVTEAGEYVHGIKVYMFEKEHAPGTSFFKPFHADDKAVTGHDGSAEFSFDIFVNDNEIYYFAVFDGDECLGSVRVSISGGESRRVNIDLGGTPIGNYVVKSIVSPTAMTIHGVNYQGDANNRSFLPVQLPVGTVRWFYCVSSNNTQVTSAFSLANGLSRLVNPIDGAIDEAFSTLAAPVGTADCNVYFIKDNENLDIFSDKSGTFEYFTEATRKNISSGIIDVNLSAQDGALWYLGFENPAPDNDIYIIVEVCALVYMD